MESPLPYRMTRWHRIGVVLAVLVTFIVFFGGLALGPSFATVFDTVFTALPVALVVGALAYGAVWLLRFSLEYVKGA